MAQPDGRPRTAPRWPARGDWRQTPDAPRGEHDRIRTGGPPARHRRSRSLPVTKLGMRRCGINEGCAHGTRPRPGGTPGRGRRPRRCRTCDEACHWADPQGLGSSPTAAEPGLLVGLVRHAPLRPRGAPSGTRRRRARRSPGPATSSSCAAAHADFRSRSAKSPPDRWAYRTPGTGHEPAGEPPETHRPPAATTCA